MNKIKSLQYLSVLLVICFTLFSCDSTSCGELTGEWKKQYEKANSIAKNFKVESIPCEYSYINLILKSKIIDTSAIRVIHKYLYNEKKSIGWNIILVYDTDGKYLFSHKYNDSIYVQKGD